jgi:hypothetical protein
MGILTFPQPKEAAAYPSWMGFLNALNDGSGGDYNPTTNYELRSDIHRLRDIYIPAGTVSTQSGEWCIILATGDVVVDGTISASGKGKANNVGTTTNGGAGGGGGGTNYYYNDGDQNGSSGSTGGGSYAGAGGTSGAGGAYGNGTSEARWGKPGGNGVNSHAFGKFPYDTLEAVTATVGAGGGSATNVGGAGGGNIIIMSRGSIRGSGAIRADGIAGINGANTTFQRNQSGSGGGGGGSLILIAKSITVPIITANGGAGGIAGTGGAYPAGNGGNGGNGMVVKMILPR